MPISVIYLAENINDRNNYQSQYVYEKCSKRAVVIDDAEQIDRKHTVKIINDGTVENVIHYEDQ